MTTITRFTKEQLIEQAKDNLIALKNYVTVYPERAESEAMNIRLAEIALASLTAEPVGTFRKGPCGYSPSFHEDAVPLYTAQPAPVAVLDERASFNAWNNDENLPIAGVGAKNAAWLAWQARAALCGNQVLDVPPERPADSSSGDDVEAWFDEGWNACRSAMLQGADQPQSAPQNIPENISSMQFKPVADLYGISVPGGRATTYSTDASEASDCRVMGWDVQEYVKLERYHDAMLQGSQPVSNGDELREQVRREHAEWSDATFGNVGPVGPLKHLSKEALEAAAEPDDLSEWADMQFLLWDAQRRAGICDGEITQAMIDKLGVNKQREWPEPKDGEPRLHIKADQQQEHK